MKLCSRLLMAFFEIYARKSYLGICNPFLEVRVMNDLNWWLVWKPVIDFLFALVELFSLSITVPELWGEMCTARLFSQGGRLLCAQLLPGQGRPRATVLGARKPETLSYATVKTASLCVPSFRHNTSVTDEQTDRRTDGRTDGRTDLP